MISNGSVYRPRNTKAIGPILNLWIGVQMRIWKLIKLDLPIQELEKGQIPNFPYCWGKIKLMAVTFLNTLMTF